MSSAIVTKTAISEGFIAAQFSKMQLACQAQLPRAGITDSSSINAVRFFIDRGDEMLAVAVCVNDPDLDRIVCVGLIGVLMLLRDGCD
jgi:hypothetical protein